jgi:ribonuclease HI
MRWKGKTEEISGGEQDTTNLRMELTAACVALEAIDEGHIVTVYSDASYLINCMRRGGTRSGERTDGSTTVKSRRRTGIYGKDSFKRRSVTKRCDGGRSREESAISWWIPKASCSRQRSTVPR